MKELMNAASVETAELAGWLGVTKMSIYHYRAGTRTPPAALIALLEYLAENPGAKEWFAKRAQKKANVSARLPGFPT